MLEILSALLNIVVLVFAVASMFSVGISHTIREIIEPLRNIREVIKALLANFVFVPLVGYLIIHLLSLDRSLQIGVMLIACAAGAPFLIKLTIVAGREVALSTSLLVLLLPTTIFYMPVVLPLIIPEIKIRALAISIPLVITMLMPLIIGFLIKVYIPHWAKRIHPFFTKLSTIALVMLIAITIIVNFKAILGVFGERAIVASILLILSAFGIGYLMGGPDIAAKDVLGLGTAQRNVGAATVVATQGFEDPNTLVVVVIGSLLTLLLLFPLAKLLRKREAKKYKTNSGPEEGLL
jgi:BASS family bile acid:Na+ symporter